MQTGSIKDRNGKDLTEAEDIKNILIFLMARIYKETV